MLRSGISFSAGAAEINAFNPDARIIMILREPAEMLYSLYHQFRFDGNERLPAFKGPWLPKMNARRDAVSATRPTWFRACFIAKPPAMPIR